MSAVVSLLIVLATLAFGAVYPWGYLPLFAAAACIGIWGVGRKRGVPAATRAVAIGLSLVAVTVGAQLVPIPRPTLNFLSPHAASLLSAYVLTFARNTDPRPLSINPSATSVALMGFTGLALYLAGLPGLLSRRDLRQLPRNLILFGALLALIGIYGREHNNGLVYGFWQPQEGSNSNGFGPFVNRNHFAGWMLMTTCLAIGVLCARIEQVFDAGKRRWRDRVLWLTTPEANRIIVIALGIAVMAVSLVWAMSRSGIVSFVCAIACFSWLMVQRRNVRRAKRVAIIAILGSVVFASLSVRGVDALLRFFGDSRDMVSRLAAWRDGWRVVRDFPITGTGMNTYADAMIFYQRNVMESWMTHAHNDYLQLVAEGGLLVAVPALIAVTLLAAGIRERVEEARGDSYDYWVRAGASVGLISIGIQELVEFSLQIPANALLFATLAAVAIAPIQVPTLRQK